MMEDEQVSADGWRAVTGADFLFPNEWQAVGGPFVEQGGFVGGAVGVRAEELGPVLG
jgi:hypothetical protein